MHKVHICTPNIWSTSKVNPGFALTLSWPHVVACALNLQQLPLPLYLDQRMLCQWILQISLAHQACLDWLAWEAAFQITHASKVSPSHSAMPRGLKRLYWHSCFGKIYTSNSSSHDQLAVVSNELLLFYQTYQSCYANLTLMLCYLLKWQLDQGPPWHWFFQVHLNHQSCLVCTLWKRGAYMLYKFWGYTGSAGGMGLMWVYPLKNVFAFSRGKFK